MQQNNLPVDPLALIQAIDRHPLSVTPETLLTDALVLMKQAHTDCTLVVKDLQLLGIVTDRNEAGSGAGGVAAATVGEIMVQPAMTLTLASSFQCPDVFTAWNLLSQHRVWHLPVVDEQHQLIGLITSEHLQAYIGETWKQMQRQILTLQTEKAELLERSQQFEQSAELRQSEDYLSVVLQEAHAQAERRRAEGDLLESQRMNMLLETVLESAGDAIEVTNTDTVIEYVNPVCEEITGYSRSEMLGKTPAMLFRSGKHDEAFYRAIEETLAAGQVWRGSLIAKCKDGSLCYQEATISPVWNKTEQVTHYVAIKRDVTDRKRVEEALRLTQFAVDHATAAAFWLKCNGDFIYINKAACQSLGYSASELILMSIHDIDPSLSAAVWAERWQTLKQNGSLSFESHHRTRDGRIFPIEITINYLKFNGTEYGFAFSRDIASRKQAEEALRLRDQAITASSNGIVIVDARLPNLPIISVNPAFEQLTGYSAAEVIGRNCRFLQGDGQDQPGLAPLRQAIREQKNCTVTLHNYRKDGTVFWNQLSISPIYDSSGSLTHFVGIQTDISDRKQAENALREVSEKRREMEHIVNQSPMVVFLWQADEDWTVEFVSENVAQFGYTSQDFYSGHILYKQFMHPDDLGRVVAELIQYTQEGQENFVYEYRITTHTGAVRWVHEFSWARRDARGFTTHYQGIIYDITEQKQAEERLKASLEEKDLLLKEVHHRVKNNLQVISSIFSLQSQGIQDPRVSSVLADSQNRICSMALIHEKLYQSNSLARIDFADYVQNLASNLFSSYNIDSNLIQLNLSISDVALNIDTAIPCGLLINELVSNSIKHAFPNRGSGEININLRVDSQEQLHLTVQDNGVGLPKDLDLQQTKSLGLRLVRALTRQLNGRLEVYSKGGTTLELIFPKPKDRKRV